MTKQKMQLSDLPIELLQAIAAHVSAWKPSLGLKALSLVCRQFQEICFPVMFKSVHIAGRSHLVRRKWFWVRDHLVRASLDGLLASQHVLNVIRYVLFALHVPTVGIVSNLTEHELVLLFIRTLDFSESYVLMVAPGTVYRTLDIDQCRNSYGLKLNASSQICRLLPAIPNLIELQVSDCLHVLANAGVCLPGIRALGLGLQGCQSHWPINLICKVFPNVEVLFLAVLGRRHFHALNLTHLKTLRYDLDNGKLRPVPWENELVNRRCYYLCRFLPPNTNTDIHHSLLLCCPQHRIPPHSWSTTPKKPLSE